MQVVVVDPERDADLVALAARLALPTTTPGGELPLLPCVMRDVHGVLLRVTLADGACDVRPTLASTRSQVHRKTSLLARAVGGRRDDEVIDATCGLGRDAQELAILGYRVLAFERHPVLAFLLRDALAASGLEIELRETDARAALAAMPAHAVHAVCLDPMFPARSKSAQVKKDAQALQQIVGHEEDAGELFAAAWHVGRRVVVKRPRLAPPLATGVSFTVEGRAVRFDVYLTLGRDVPDLNAST